MQFRAATPARRRGPRAAPATAAGSGAGIDRGPRQMFPATCSKCGRSTEVPFRPTNGKPVYCSDCFRAARGN